MNIAFRRFSLHENFSVVVRKRPCSHRLPWESAGSNQDEGRVGLRLVRLCLGFLHKFASHSEASWPHDVGTGATASTELVFFSLSIRGKHCYLLVTMRKKPKELLRPAWLASLAIRRPVTAVVVCTGCHNLTLGGFS